jgi:hypothetical protein
VEEPVVLQPFYKLEAILELLARTFHYKVIYIIFYKLNIKLNF